MAESVGTATVESAQNVCDEGEQPGGARYRICMPAAWNGGLVLYAHGYVAATRPVGFPEEQFMLGDVGDVSQLVTDRGFAFAATSYRANGLVIQDGIADLLELVEIFRAQHGTPGTTLLAGVSEGALIATLALERYPQVYDGALAMCGPYGDFQRQINYLGDFRVVFDYFFPDLLPPTPVNIPPALIENWETGTYSNTVLPQILAPGNAISVTQLLQVTSAPVDPDDEATRAATIERLLWYNVFATNDARAKLGGQPYDNTMRQYSSPLDESLDEGALNAGVARFAADPAATARIAADYETTGVLPGPVVVLHTTGDPITPIWHVEWFVAKVDAAGRTDQLEIYTLPRYGHCSFAVLEILSAFDRLVELAAAQREVHYLPAVNR